MLAIELVECPSIWVCLIFACCYTQVWAQLPQKRCCNLLRASYQEDVLSGCPIHDNVNLKH